MGTMLVGIETVEALRTPRRERVASLGEVRDAIEALSKADLLRLERYSIWRMRGLGNFIDGRSHEDLLYEAIRLVLEGRRQWRPGKVEFVGCLLGAIRSIASNWARRLAPISTFDPSCVDRLNAVASPAPSAEDRLLREEREAAILRRFDDDAHAITILTELRDGASFADIRSRNGMSRLQYDATMRRIRRRVGGR